MSSDTLYEHPLNEHVRAYLRLECLLIQLESNSSLNEPGQWHIFFKCLFDLIEILEQVHIRGELAKYLEKQRVKLEAWLNVPEVDTEQLHQLLAQSRQLQHTLLRAPRPGLLLREDRFLSSIRQRFSLPGGMTSFDVPSLHHWLNLTPQHKDNDILRWKHSIRPLEEALLFWLQLTRNSAVMQPCSIAQGFYQQDIENANLLRIQLSHEFNVYPLVSGYKTRFAIRFMAFDDTLPIPEDIALLLAIC